MKLPDRNTFSDRLEAALTGDEPIRALNGVLRDVLTTELGSWETPEQQLVRLISERLDVANGEPERLLALTRNIHPLLDRASSTASIELLIELLADRERVVRIIRKHINGTINRTSFLSFISEQSWPQSVRKTIASLTADEVDKLAVALEARDISRLELILSC